MNKKSQADEISVLAGVELETALRAALSHQDPPAGLAERIMVRAEAGFAARMRVYPMRRYAVVLSACAAALLIFTMVVFSVIRQRQIEAVQAEQARARLLYALQVTSQELTWAERKVNQSVVRPGDPPPRSTDRQKNPEEL